MKPIVIHLHTVQRSGRTAAIAGCICLLAALTTSRLHADEAPLYEQEPYDTIKLDAENKNVLLKVFPLELPGRKIPAKPKEYEELEIRLVDRPRNTYRVLWSHIAEVKLFERMVLDEADRLTELGKFDEAYPYFQFLERRYPKMEDLRPPTKNTSSLAPPPLTSRGGTRNRSASSGNCSITTPATRTWRSRWTAWPTS